MKTLMIHECTDAHLKYDYEDHILTFDDGLYTQYKYLDFWKSLPNRCIFFITPTIICNGEQDTSFITAPDAHEYFFRTGDAKYYMTVDQIKECMDCGIEIGMHGYEHKRLTSVGGLIEQREFVIDQMNKANEWFYKNIQFRPRSYCHPYNDSTFVMDLYLKGVFNFQEVFGTERTELII
jgi:peptidoglycan/xylan/chitin deacetylase (PgdA/CDA1 family)